MGKLTIRGTAFKEYEYDQVRLTFGFEVHETTTEKALKKVLNQCESFLAYLENHGVDLKTVHIGDNDVYQTYHDGKMRVKAERELVLRLPFNMTSINAMLLEIQSRNFNVDIHTSYELSNPSEVENELLRLAVADSRKKAEMIAGSINQKITGIKSIRIEGDEEPDKIIRALRMDEKCDFDKAAASLPRSNELAGALTTEEANVEVVWLIE